KKYSFLEYKVLPTENQEEFDALLEEYRKAYAPKGIHEEFLVLDMARSHWNIARMLRIEPYARDVPDGLKTIGRYAAESRRTLRRCHKMLLSGRRITDRREKDTPERRALRELGEQGALPPGL